ncbi:MAG: copper chaperone PCu(A)C [Rhodobacteraceae bacterium]|nr:copper chaperone PCu(A)C [Paracoccaceae bacterium]
MEPVRVVLTASFFAMAGVAFWVFSGSGRLAPITVTGAELAPLAEGFALTAKIVNPGGPDVLTGIGSEDAGQAKLTGGVDALAIPARGTPALSMDGVHGVLMGVMGDTGEGRLVPVSLWFGAAGKVTVRARISGVAGRDHDKGFDVPEGEPRPGVALQVVRQGDGWKVMIETRGFSFAKDAVDGPHRPGAGHGHLYLNGLKLQRVFGPEARIGALPRGQHELRVTLNTNDHRAYRLDGALVSATAQIVVD